MKTGFSQLCKLAVFTSLWGLMSCKTTESATVPAHRLPGVDVVFIGEQVADTVFVAVAPIPADTTLTWKEYIEATGNGCCPLLTKYMNDKL